MYTPKLFVIPLFFVIFLYAGLSMAQPEVPADGLKLHKTKRTVVFNHSTHKKDITCVTCHHLVDGKENFASCAKAGCHDNVADRTDTSKKGYHNVFHNIDLKAKTCNSCHLDFVTKHPDKEQAMSGCAESKCHP